MLETEMLIEMIDSVKANKDLYKLLSLREDREKAIPKLCRIMSCISISTSHRSSPHIPKIHQLSYETLSTWFASRGDFEQCDNSQVNLFFTGAKNEIFDALSGPLDELYIAASRIAIDGDFELDSIVGQINDSFNCGESVCDDLAQLCPYLSIAYWRPDEVFLDFLLAIFDKYVKLDAGLTSLGEFIDALMASLGKHSKYVDLASLEIDAKWHWSGKNVVGSVCKSLGGYSQPVYLCETKQIQTELAKRFQSTDSNLFWSALYYCINARLLLGFELPANWKPPLARTDTEMNCILFAKAIYGELSESEMRAIRMIPDSWRFYLTSLLTYKTINSSMYKRTNDASRYLLQSLSEADDWNIDVDILGLVLCFPSLLDFDLVLPTITRYKRQLMFLCGSIIRQHAENIRICFLSMTKDNSYRPQKNMDYTVELRNNSAAALHKLTWGEVRELLDEAKANHTKFVPPRWCELEDSQRELMKTFELESERFSDVEKLHASSIMTVLRAKKEDKLVQRYFVENIDEILKGLEKGERDFPQLFSELIESSRELISDNDLKTIIDRVSRIRGDMTLSDEANNEAADLLQKLAPISPHRYIPE